MHLIRACIPFFLCHNTIDFLRLYEVILTSVKKSTTIALQILFVCKFAIDSDLCHRGGIWNLFFTKGVIEILFSIIELGVSRESVGIDS